MFFSEQHLASAHTVLWDLFISYVLCHQLIRSLRQKHSHTVSGSADCTIYLCSRMDMETEAGSSTFATGTQSTAECQTE